MAAACALGGSLGLDAALVAAGTELAPSIRGYGHFHVSDYGLLTVVGVVGACLAWYVVARISSSPRRLLLRLAVVVTAVLWLPDLVLLLAGQPPRAVAVLALMHLAVALVTYNALVRLAPAAPGPGPRGHGGSTTSAPPAAVLDQATLAHPRRGRGIALAVLVGAEFVLGTATLVVVPYHRRNGWVPNHGVVLYDLHAVVGGLLGIGAVALVLTTRRATRLLRVGAAVGLVGVVLGAGGGLASSAHATRLLGVGLMFLGSLVAGFGYLIFVVGPGQPDLPSG